MADCTADCTADYKLNLCIPVYYTNRRPIKNMIGVVMNRLVGMALNPQDTYPLGHIPPRTYTPGKIPSEQIRLAQTFETERNKLLFTVVINIVQITQIPLFLP